jgi:hypothetical protein
VLERAARAAAPGVTVERTVCEVTERLADRLSRELADGLDLAPPATV